MLRYLMENYVARDADALGYQHVWTGHLVKEQPVRDIRPPGLYQDGMFPPMEMDNGVLRRSR